MNVCKKCGNNCEKEYCWKCKSRKKLKSSGLNKKRKELTEKDISEIEKMNNFFLSIWKRRKHHSELSKYPLFSPPSSAYFHHILEKQKYPEAKYDEDNIILITMDEHSNVHFDPTRYEIINKRREQLIKKYEKEKDI